jgi:dipeptidyl aminopeptidase/acylaminoacyl peptidase
VKLTNGPDGDGNPLWAPDGSMIAFTSKRGDDKHAQIYVIRTDGGEASRLTEHPTGPGSPAWAPDGKSILFIAAEDDTADEKKRKKAKDDIFAFEDHFKHRHLWRVTVGDRKTSRVTHGDYTVRGFRVSGDGSKIVHARAPSPSMDDGPRSELWLMGADGTNAARLTTNDYNESNPELSPDKRHLLYLADSDGKGGHYYNENLFVMPAAGGEARLLLAEMPHEVSSARWSKDGKSIYFTANTGVANHLFVVDLATEKLTQLTSGYFSLVGWDFQSGPEIHAVEVASPTSPGEVHLLRVGAAPQQVTKVFADLAATFNLPRTEVIRWPGADGVTVEGLLHYPIRYQAGKRYPLAVQTHGGPRSSDKLGSFSWARNIQVLATQGYAVLQPNYRGSTGYGDAFLRDMVGGYFRQSHLDVMTGVDQVIALGVADPERMVKLGWSAGGHMTNKIITHTNRFKAASSGAGAVNWVSMYGQSDTRTYRTPWFGGTPWQANAPLDRYWEHSPIKDIAKVTTPTLVLVGAEDERVPPPQSLELYRALKSNGVPTRLYLAPREPHGWRELRHRLFKMNAELDWFAKYALGTEYQWEQPPKLKAGDDKGEP